ncbi:MAG: cytochrome c3 family protein, partial [Bdellovibrionota bacterium]
MRAWGLALLLTLSFVAPQAHAVEGLLNRLLAPGPLLRGHDDLEKKDCLKCHDMGKGVPDSKCMDCHKDIGAQVKEKKSFHGLHKKSCSECHADHKGRDFDTVKIDQKKFDHKETGFSLTGKHADIDCAKCHVEKRKKNVIRSGDIRWFGQTTTCVSCHKKDDIHFFKGAWAKKDCASCHGEKSWKTDLKFDHEKDGKYRLEGKHLELKCQDCHNPNKKNRKESVYQWKKLKTDKCLTCHENIHKKHMSPKYLGPDCTTCHSQKSWKISKFDHFKVTHFEIEGGHAKLKCTDCHKQSYQAIAQGKSHYHWMGVSKKCQSCHEDVHKNHLSQKFRGKCEICHSVENWKIKDFAHEKITQYALRGKHGQIQCNDCHKQKQAVLDEARSKNTKKNFHWEGLKSKCLACHKDEHQFGQFKSKHFKTPNDCLECHNETKWKPTPRFDHTRDTEFPMDGKHVPLKCKDCHLEKDKFKRPVRWSYHWPELNKKNCELCHANVHVNSSDKQFKLKRCDDCHLTSGWKVLANNKNFDHGATRFKLSGKHVKVTCKECHEVKGKKIYRWETFDKNFCISCHENVHSRQFSSLFNDQACDKCHGTENFKSRFNFNHDETRYKLLHKHKDVKCEKCHIDTSSFFKTKPPTRMHQYQFHNLGSQNCALCHKDPHKGNFGAACSNCHTEKGWKITEDFHKNFTLTGVHYTLQCQECHKNERKLSGMSEQCILCHQKDDIHSGTQPQCGECHRQLFWENAEFKHSL